MNWPRTIVLTGLALAIVIAGATIVSSQQDSDSADGQSEAAEIDPSSAPTETQVTETQATESPTPTSEPPTPEKERTNTFVGRVDGGAGTLAVVDHGGEATAYFCDGASLEAWLSGSATAGRLRMSGDNGGLRGGFNGQQATGSVRVEGSRFDFSLRQVSPPKGLYRVADTIDGAEVTGGWIVLPSGRQIGVLTVDGQSQPAPQLDPATGRVTIDGQTLTAEPA
ncbi:MAG TPA: hypothetical protein VEX15_16590 [Nocardioidaceae bacterium]|nr:hypothetical protein [Nocardioidaceae bacterium]